MNTTPRFSFHDSQATSHAPRNTAVNPRYWILDNDPEAESRVYDELTSAKAARDTVRDLNRGLYGPLATS